MKKKILLIFILFAFNKVVSQPENKETKPKKAVYKGKHAINLYYGTSFTSAIADAFFFGIDNIKYKTVGPIGIVYEYPVTDNIGLGTEFSYKDFTFSFDQEVTGNGTVDQVNYELRIITYRAFLRANFHFANSDKFDAYGFISGGYIDDTYSFKSSDSNNSYTFALTGLMPFGVKAGVGSRYFFTKNIGLSLEVAAGTPIIAGGLAIRL